LCNIENIDSWYVSPEIFSLAVRRKLLNSLTHERWLTKFGLPGWFPCFMQKRGVAVDLVPRPMRQLTFPSTILPKLTLSAGLASFASEKD
jgi:hypothetical protein